MIFGKRANHSSQNFVTESKVAQCFDEDLVYSIRQSHEIQSKDHFTTCGDNNAYFHASITMQQ